MMNNSMFSDVSFKLNNNQIIHLHKVISLFHFLSQHTHNSQLNTQHTDIYWIERDIDTHTYTNIILILFFVCVSLTLTLTLTYLSLFVCIFVCVYFDLGSDMFTK
jgi:hypothetical protein